MLNVNSNQLNQSKIKNIEDGAKGSGFFFFFFYYKRRSGACYVVGFSCSKLRSRTSSGACCVAAASSHVPKPKSSEAYCIAASSRAGQAPEFAALQQQAPEPDKLRSLLRCSNKLSRSGACCCNAASSHALELGALQQASSGAWCVAGFSCSKQAPKPRSFGEASEVGACLPLQTKQTKIK